MNPLRAIEIVAGLPANPVVPPYDATRMASFRLGRYLCFSYRKTCLIHSKAKQEEKQTMAGLPWARLQLRPTHNLSSN